MGQRRGSDGAAAVEFALVSSLFFLLLFGIIQYGLWFNDSLNLRQGVRETARQGVVEGFQSCGAAVTSSDKLVCQAKSEIGAITGPTYVKVWAPHGWSKGSPLVVCGLIKSDGAIGFLPMPNDGWIGSETQMSIEQEVLSGAWHDKTESLPAGENWDWCKSS